VVSIAKEYSPCQFYSASLYQFQIQNYEMTGFPFSPYMLHETFSGVITFFAK
jgi:hypothetical protein